MGSWRERRRLFRRKRSPTSPPVKYNLHGPLPDYWQDGIPLWEKKFCTSIGRVPWQKIVDAKYLIVCHSNVLSWDDSGAKEAFDKAKKNYWEKINNIHCDDSPPHPEIYLGDIDWNCDIDPELVKDLEREYFAPPEEEEMTFTSKKRAKSSSSYVGQEVNGENPQDFHNYCVSDNMQKRNPWESVNMQKRNPWESDNMQKCNPLESDNMQKCNPLESDNMQKCNPLESDNMQKCNPLESDNMQKCNPLESDNMQKRNPWESDDMQNCNLWESTDDTKKSNLWESDNKQKSRALETCEARGQDNFDENSCDLDNQNNPWECSKAFEDRGLLKNVWKCAGPETESWGGNQVKSCSRGWHDVKSSWDHSYEGCASLEDKSWGDSGFDSRNLNKQTPGYHVNNCNNWDTALIRNKVAYEAQRGREWQDKSNMWGWKHQKNKGMYPGDSEFRRSYVGWRSHNENDQKRDKSHLSPSQACSRLQGATCPVGQGWGRGTKKRVSFPCE